MSASVDLSAIAIACGYRYCASCDDRAGFERALARAGEVGGPALVHARIAPGSMTKLGRPTVSPDAVARRFRAFLTA